MKKILEFFQDDKGRMSNARLGNLLILISFTCDYITHIVRAIEFNPSVTIVGIVGTIMGIKVAQKFAENKNGKG